MRTLITLIILLASFGHAAAQTDDTELSPDAIAQFAEWLQQVSDSAAAAPDTTLAVADPSTIVADSIAPETAAPAPEVADAAPTDDSVPATSAPADEPQAPQPFTGTRYALCYDDWRAGTWHDIDAVEAEKRNIASKFIMGGGELELTTGNKKVDEAISKSVFLLQRDSTLYINLRGYKYQKAGFGNNFTRAWMTADSTLIFAHQAIGNKENRVSGVAQSVLGVVGAVAVHTAQMRLTALYMVTDSDKKVQRMSKAAVRALLAGSPQALSRFDRLTPGTLNVYQASVALECLQMAKVI